MNILDGIAAVAANALHQEHRLAAIQRLHLGGRDNGHGAVSSARIGRGHDLAVEEIGAHRFFDRKRVVLDDEKGGRLFRMQRLIGRLDALDILIATGIRALMQQK